MENRTAILLAIGVGSTGLVIGFLVSRSSVKAAVDEARAAARMANEAAASREKAVAPEPPVLERPESRVPALTESPKAPEPPQATPATVPPASEFAALLSMPEATKAEKKAKEKAIRATLNERTMPIFQRRFEAGLADFVHADLSYDDPPEDEGVIRGIQMQAGKGTFRTVLSRSEYPDLYELHDAADRLAKESSAMEIEEIRAAQAQGGTPTPK